MIKSFLTCRHWYKVPAGNYSCKEGPTLARLRKDFHWEILTDKSWDTPILAPVKHRVIGISLDREFKKDSFSVFYQRSALNDRLTFYGVRWKSGYHMSWELKTVEVGESLCVDLKWDSKKKMHNLYLDSEFMYSMNIAEAYRWGWRLTPLRAVTSPKDWVVKINKKIFS